MSTVETDHAGRRNQFGKGTPKGVRNGDLRLVVAPKPRQGPVSKLRGGNIRSECLQDPFNVWSQPPPVHRRERRVGRARRECAGPKRSVTRYPASLAGFSKIVVIAGHPEDRNDRALPLSLEHPRECRGRERLVHGVERTSKEPRLLTGGDRDGTRLTKPRQSLLASRAGHQGLAERGVERALAETGELDGGSDRRRYNAWRHPTCPRKMVRAESGPSAPPS